MSSSVAYEQQLDPVAQFGERTIERRPCPARDRVGDRPVQPAVVRVEVFVGLIAHRDHDARQHGAVVQRPRERAGKVESGPAGRGDSTRVHSIRRMSSGRLGRLAGE